jgi:hypothetical protein
MADRAAFAYERSILVSARTAHINALTERTVGFLASIERSAVTNHVRLCIG